MIGIDRLPPLQKASAENQLKKVKKELKKAKPDSLDPFGRTALHYACFNGNLEIVKYLIKNKATIIQDEEGENPLHYAAKAGQVLVLDLLLKSKLELNAHQRTSLEKVTVLHILIQRCYPGEKGETIGLFVEILKKLVKLPKVSINCQNQAGATPLHIACSFGDRYYLCVRELLALKADPNLTDGDGLTPIHFAARGGSEKLVQALARGGAKLSFDSNLGTPKDLARKNGHNKVADFLQQIGAAEDLGLRSTSTAGPSLGKRVPITKSTTHNSHLRASEYVVTTRTGPNFSTPPPRMAQRPRSNLTAKPITGGGKLSLSGTSFSPPRNNSSILSSSGGVGSSSSPRSCFTSAPSFGKTKRSLSTVTPSYSPSSPSLCASTTTPTFSTSSNTAPPPSPPRSPPPPPPSPPRSPPPTPPNHSPSPSPCSSAPAMSSPSITPPQASPSAPLQIHTPSSTEDNSHPTFPSSSSSLCAFSSSPTYSADVSTCSTSTHSPCPSPSSTSPPPSPSQPPSPSPSPSPPSVLQKKTKIEAQQHISDPQFQRYLQQKEARAIQSEYGGLQIANNTPSPSPNNHPRTFHSPQIRAHGARPSQGQTTGRGAKGQTTGRGAKGQWQLGEESVFLPFSSSEISPSSVVFQKDIDHLEFSVRLLEQDDPMRLWHHSCLKHAHGRASSFFKPPIAEDDPFLDNFRLISFSLDESSRQSLSRAALHTTLLAVHRRWSLSIVRKAFPPVEHPVFRSHSFSAIGAGVNALKSFLQAPVLWTQGTPHTHGMISGQVICGVMANICLVVYRMGWMDLLPKILPPLLHTNRLLNGYVPSHVIADLSAGVEFWTNFKKTVESLDENQAKDVKQNLCTPPSSLTSAPLPPSPPPLYFSLTPEGVNNLLSESAQAVKLCPQQEGGELLTSSGETVRGSLTSFLQRLPDAGSNILLSLKSSVQVFLQQVDATLQETKSLEGERMLTDFTPFELINTEDLTTISWLVRSQEDTLQLHAARMYEAISSSCVCDNNADGVDLEGVQETWYDHSFTLHFDVLGEEGGRREVSVEQKKAQRGKLLGVLLGGGGEGGRNLLRLAYRPSDMNNKVSHVVCSLAVRSVCLLLWSQFVGKDNPQTCEVIRGFMTRHSELFVHTILSNFSSLEPQVLFHSMLSLGFHLATVEVGVQQLNTKFPGYVWKCFVRILEMLSPSSSTSCPLKGTLGAFHLLSVMIFLILQLARGCLSPEMAFDFIGQGGVGILMRATALGSEILKQRGDRLKTNQEEEGGGGKGNFDEAAEERVAGELERLEEEMAYWGAVGLSHIARQCTNYQMKLKFVESRTLPFILNALQNGTDGGGGGRSQSTVRIRKSALMVIGFVFVGVPTDQAQNILASVNCSHLFNLIGAMANSARGLVCSEQVPLCPSGPSPLQYKVNSLISGAGVEIGRAVGRQKGNKWAGACKHFQIASQRLQIVLEWYPDNQEAKNLIYHCYFGKATSQKQLGMGRCVGTEQEKVALEAARVNFENAGKYVENDPFAAHQVAICLAQKAAVTAGVGKRRFYQGAFKSYQTCMKYVNLLLQSNSPSPPNSPKSNSGGRGRVPVENLRLVCLVNWGMSLLRYGGEMVNVMERLQGEQKKAYIESGKRMLTLSEERFQGVLKVERGYQPALVGMGLAVWRKAQLAVLEEGGADHLYQMAVNRFQEVLQQNKDHCEALYNLCLVYGDWSTTKPQTSTDAKSSAWCLQKSLEHCSRLVEVAPNFQPGKDLLEFLLGSPPV